LTLNRRLLDREPDVRVSARAARAGQQQDAGGARPRWFTRDAPLPKLVVDGRRHKPATGRGKSDRHGGSKASLPGMAAALESGETSAVVAFDAHGKAKASGESKKDFVARRTSWLAAYRQALKRRAAASQKTGHDLSVFSLTYPCPRIRSDPLGSARPVPVYLEIWYVYRFPRAHYGEPPSRTGCSVVW
jgi:hypothetical protein